MAVLAGWPARRRCYPATAVCAQVERLGGKVLVPPTTSKDRLVFADVHDPAGNHFGVFTPPPA